MSAVSSQGGPSQKGSPRGCQVPRGAYLGANVQALSCACSREGSSLPVEVLGVATLSRLSRPSGRMCLAGRRAPGEQHAHGACPCRFHLETLDPGLEWSVAPTTEGSPCPRDSPDQSAPLSRRQFGFGRSGYASATAQGGSIGRPTPNLILGAIRGGRSARMPQKPWAYSTPRLSASGATMVATRASTRAVALASLRWPPARPSAQPCTWSSSMSSAAR